jgi:glycosyltransferase involved in cell wall biosynthesis
VASADLFVFPSMTETFGNVVTEALSSGVPVVAYDHAAASQLLQPGVNGQHLPLGQERAFIEAVVAAARDRHALQRWRNGARRSVEALDWSGVVARFEAELREAISDPVVQAGFAPNTTAQPSPQR